MNTPSLNDGFNGARDASLLERYEACLGMGVLPEGLAPGSQDLMNSYPSS